MRRNRSLPHFFSGENFRFLLLNGFFFFFFALVLYKLFLLQVVQSEDLKEQAKEIRSSSIEISARRGSIFTTDSKTGEITPLAINTTLYKVFVDARQFDNKGNTLTPTENLPLIAHFLTEELYTREKFNTSCLQSPNTCPKGSVLEIKDDKDIVIHRTLPKYESAKRLFEKEILEKISEQKTSLIYATEVKEETLREIENRGIPNLSVSLSKKSVQVDLQGLTENNKQQIASVLSEFFGGKTENIAEKLVIGRKGYVPILSRIRPEMREKILQKKQSALKKYALLYANYKKKLSSGSTLPPPQKPFLSAIGFSPEPIRYYPENSLLSNVVGFVANGVGKYGIEKYFESHLSGEDGVLETSRDINGNAVTIQKNKSEYVQDGGDVVLTIDRILQKKVEEILDKKREEYDADSAQAILMNPTNGKILVMANSPRFDPNFFGDVYERRRTTPEDFETIYKTTPLEQKDREGNFINAKYKDFEKAWELGFDPEYFVFENRWGSAAYDNKIVSSLYEPGSVMKPLIMAAALEEGEITPSSRYFESAPLEIGAYKIRNADNRYLGSQSMTNIIERSANLGMAYIAKRLGKPILYDALKNMKFGEYTDISLPDELSGNVNYYKSWSDARMYNASFGQGFSATPLQVIQAWSALANGGYIVSPRIVSSLRYPDGSSTHPQSKRTKIFSAQTVSDMTKILIASTENGVAKKGQVRGHYIAGKTGTSQITKINGSGYEDLSEKGSTITGFVGFAPVDDPQYLLLVKFDRPRKGQNGRSVYGSSTAAPTFSEIMKSVFFYYDTPRDKF